MQAAPGQDAFVPLSTPAGEGKYTTPLMVTGADDRNAANHDNAPVALADRTNWIARRAIDFLHAGVAAYVPRGTVKFAANALHGWWFDCVVALTNALTVSDAGHIDFEGTTFAKWKTGTALVTDPGATAQFMGTTNQATKINFVGAQPAKTDDPGANVATALSQCKAWARIHIPGGGGAATIVEGYNIASVASSGYSALEITFARAMANANYSVTVTPVYTFSWNGAATGFAMPTTTGTTSKCYVQFTDLVGAAVPCNNVGGDVMVQVFGRQ